VLHYSPQPTGSGAAVVESAREFVNRAVRPTAQKDDEACVFRRELFDEVAKHRLHSLTHPAEFGGRAMSFQLYYPTLLELARGSMALSVSVSVTNLVQGAILEYGTAEQREHFYRKLVSGEWMGAFSLSEPQSGSDAAGLRLSAKKVPGGYKLNGSKCWCSNAGFADVYLVMCRTGEHRTKGITALLVPKDTPGFRVGKLEKKLGLRASTLAELVFEDCFVPETHRISDEGAGFEVALSQLDAGRISIGAIALAAVIESIETAWRWHRANPGVMSEVSLQTLASHFAEGQAIYSLLLQAATEKDQGLSVTQTAAQVKLLASELAMRTTSDAVHFMGRAGVDPGNHVERFFRDAKAMQIVEGTTQVQKLVLVRELDALIE
jgi:alkylation response protein AidB-like acyl-CoA dehydrogenase